jgi:uncharacterized zinc-type alcohol dehydrogenase-like protein
VLGRAAGDGEEGEEGGSHLGPSIEPQREAEVVGRPRSRWGAARRLAAPGEVEDAAAMRTKAYAALSETTGPEPFTLERRDLRPDDVSIAIDWCGVCHTDIHYGENDWGTTRYPVVPGHEIVGRVAAVGGDVTRFTPGDVVGVGTFVDSCGSCRACTRGFEQYCEEGMVATYNGVDRVDGSTTYGGYAKAIVVRDAFVHRIPEGLDPASTAPILCAGITTYSPLKHHGVGPGARVGVVGMGGLGHMGIKLANALGAEVTVFTRSPSKVAEAERNGAARVVVTSRSGALEAAAGSLDYVLDTVPVEHDLNPYLNTLAFGGIYILVGQMTPLQPPVAASALVRQRRTLSGSLVGGVAETRELLELCAAHGIGCDVERVSIDRIDEAWARVKRGDVRYRFVIDMRSL